MNNPAPYFALISPKSTASIKYQSTETAGVFILRKFSDLNGNKIKKLPILFWSLLTFLFSDLAYAGPQALSMPLGNATSAWDEVPAILARIVAPTFPERDFNIDDYGAVADNATDIKPAVDEAIAECHAAGGVLIPSGNWFIAGPIHLKSKVNLHLSEGATLNFSTNPTDYEPLVFTRFEGTELMNYSPLIYAFEQENIGVTGRGTFHGRATQENWWTSPAKGRGTNIKKARQYGQGKESAPVSERIFGSSKPGLRPVFVQLEQGP